jgi:hypothetical protein
MPQRILNEDWEDYDNKDMRDYFLLPLGYYIWIYENDFRLVPK